MREHFLELIRKTSTELPDDIFAAINKGFRSEATGSAAKSALDDVMINSRLATATVRPICQDTGTNVWYVYHPIDVSQASLTKDILAATRKATKLAYLRPNAVDSITGENSGDNTGRGIPVIHFHQWSKKSVAADLLLKGGGSENVSAQYALPNVPMGAGRDLEGVRKVVIDAVFQAQGKGCGPGILGIAIGGDRATSMMVAKEQLFRLLTDKNPDKGLAKLEKRLLKECNQLGIGPMGFGGQTTVIGVKAASLHRLPASYYVSIAYLCWAARRCGLVVAGNKAKFSQTTQIAAKYLSSGKGKR